MSADEKINYIEELLEEEIKRENLDEGLEVTEEVQEELSESILFYLLGSLKYKHLNVLLFFFTERDFQKWFHEELLVQEERSLQGRSLKKGTS